MTSPTAVAFALLAAASSVGAQASRPAPDTVDVAVGSALVDFSKHVAGTTRAVQEMTMGGQTRHMPPVLWTFTFSDTGPRPLLLVHASPEQPNAAAPPMPTFVFDRRSVALRQIRDAATAAPLLSIDGASVQGQVPGPGGPVPVNATLSEPGFFRPLADLVAESLPRTLGVVYRVPLWGPPAPAIGRHLYQIVRREPVTVLGTTHPQAWVLEDRSADGATLLGTMWLIDSPPFLVRWIINQPNGAVVHLDQEVAR